VFSFDTNGAAKLDKFYHSNGCKRLQKTGVDVIYNGFKQ
jgi:hypothetical protein